jgi:predicted porin
MKKSLLALAVLSAFAGAASAQSSVTLSGRVDAGVVRAGGAWGLGGSQSGYNALTFSGTEDLGGGMRAFFALNHRFNISNGNVFTPGGAFFRQSWVGLGGGFGDVRLGKMLMPLQDMNGGYDAFDTGYVASTHTGGIFATIRATNAIYYRTPSLGGFFVHAAIAAADGQIPGECQFNLAANFPTNATAAIPRNCFGNSTAASVNAAERPIGFAAGYAGGPVRVGLAYDRNGADDKTIGLYGGFNFGFANLMAQYEKGDRGPSTEVDRWSVSAKVPLGAATFKVGYTKWSDEDVSKLGVGLQYDLSKRTNLYTNVGKFSGDGTDLGSTSTIRDINKKTRFDIGVTHAF